MTELQEKKVKLIKSQSLKSDFYCSSLVAIFPGNRSIDFDFFSDEDVCLTFDEVGEHCESQLVCKIWDLDENYLNDVLESVDNIEDCLDHYVNESYVNFLRNLLK